MSFAPGTGIDCAGTVTNAGTATFTSTSPSTQWNGILLTGAASQIEGAVINNALIGIKADQNAGHSITNCTIDGGNYGVFLYSGNSPGAQLSTTVANNTITHSSVAGIFVDNTSKPIIQNNILQGLLAPIVGNYGIVFMFSSPQNVVGNKISAYGNAGVYCYKSSPALVDEADAGYNCSFNNTGTGVLAENKAFPVLGILDEHLPGKNTFASNQNFQITLIDNCEVYSEENFYREPEPIESQDFSVDGSSTLHFDPFLPTDPNECISGSAPLSVGGGEKGGDDPPSASPIGALLRQVVKLRIRGQHAAAMAILKNVAADPQSSVDVKMWAVHEMVANYQLMARQSGVNRLSAYLGALRLSQSNNEVRRAISDALPRSLHREGDYAATIAALDDNVRQFPNTSSKLVALFAKVSLAVNELHDATMAQNAFQVMQATSRTSRLTKLAEKLIESSPSSSSNSLAKGGELSSLGAPRPREFALEQNYPNPFNPTTTIRYALPNDGIISLKVFDILGREVATLESGFKLAGTYESVFSAKGGSASGGDAAGLASGMYIYRLSAGATTLSRKMIIMK